MMTDSDIYKEVGIQAAQERESFQQHEVPIHDKPGMEWFTLIVVRLSRGVQWSFEDEVWRRALITVMALCLIAIKAIDERKVK